MQIFFGTQVPFAYPSAPAATAAAPAQAQAAAPSFAQGAVNPFSGSSFSLFGNPYQTGGQSAAVAGSAAGAAGAAHTVVNSTNALKSSEATAAGQAFSGAATSFPGAVNGGFGGGYLVPAFAAPVMVPGFFVVAVPFAVAAPTPVAAPVPPAPVVEEPAAPVVEAPVVAEAPVVDVAPVTDASEPDDLSAPLTRLFDSRSEVDFALTLTTLEGDTVEVSFRQEATASRGVTIDGDSRERLDRGPGRTLDDSFELKIDGALNSEERQAIDALMDDVLALSESFFRGDDSAVTRGLLNLQLDGDTMSELALSLSVTQSVQVQRGYGRDVDALEQIKSRGGDQLATLEFLASEQKQLIEQARQVFDAPSSVRLVRDSLGPLLQGAMDALTESLADTFAVLPPVTEADPAEDDVLTQSDPEAVAEALGATDEVQPQETSAAA